MNINLSPLTFRDIEYLVSIAEFGTFSAAAKKCAVSQPALSIQVKKVEELLQVKIFQRGKRRVTLTHIGQEIIEQSRAVLREIETIGTLAKSNQGPYGEFLRLGVISSLSPYLLPLIISTFKRKLKGLEVNLTEGTSYDLLDSIGRGTIDAAITALPLPRSDLSITPIFQEELVAIIASSHPLAQRKSLRITDLKFEEMILLDPKNALADHILALFGQTRESAAGHQVTTSIETLKFMVATTGTYSIAPALAVCDKRLARSGLVWRPIQPVRPSRVIALACKRRPRKTDVYQSLAKLIGQAVTKQAAGIVAITR